MQREVDLARRAEIGRERRARTRTAIIRAAIDVIAEKGEDAATTQDFMEKAGVSRGTFYNTFDAKKGVLTAVADHLMDSLNAQIIRESEDIENADERLAWILHRVLEGASRDPNWAHALLVAVWRNAPNVVGETTMGYLLADLNLGRDQGFFAPMDDAVSASIIFGSMLFGMRAVLDRQYGSEQKRLLVSQVLVALGDQQLRASKVSESIQLRCQVIAERSAIEY